MRTIILAAAASLVAATPALAAGEAGPYVGVGVTHDNLAGSGNTEGLGINGVGGTVFAGYNFDFGSKAFAGAEANFDLASAKLGNDVNGLKADNAFGASARLGYRLSDAAALYGRVGYQRGRVTTRSDGLKESFSRDGLRLGGGLEANVTSNVAVRVEYNHTHYYDNNDGVELNNNQAVVGLVYGF